MMPTDLAPETVNIIGLIWAAGVTVFVVTGFVTGKFRLEREVTREQDAVAELKAERVDDKESIRAARQELDRQASITARMLERLMEQDTPPARRAPARKA